MPSAAVIDSQSVKGGQLPAVSCGYDAGKKIKGRKRHALTDTNGLLLGVVVTPADVQDRDGAKLLLCMFCHGFLSLLMIFADGGYAGKLRPSCRAWDNSSVTERVLPWGSSRSSKTRRASWCCRAAGSSSAALAGW
ncbi:MAG: transposase [Verrucomicrobiaceae bacterium]|nr:transposase [Verrucomicrobiaceae bacterium]